MRVSRVSAFLVGSASAAVALYGALTDELGTAALLAVALAAAGLLVVSFARFSRRRTKQILAGASVLSSVLFLAALGLQFRPDASLEVRAALAGLLLSGALLSLKCLHQLSQKTRYGFHNYYDVPNRS